MIILKILSILYILYIFKKTELIKKLKNKDKYLIYTFLILLALTNTKIVINNNKIDVLSVGIGVVLLEVLLKNFKKFKINTKYILLKIYMVLLLVILLYRGGLWISQLL